MIFAEDAVDWWTIFLLALIAAFWAWRFDRDKKRQAEAQATIARDTKTYENIKAGVREYDWRNQDAKWMWAKDGEKLFETAHLIAYRVEHFAEMRLGFFFKDTQEFGLYGHFAGNGHEFHESYYRSDRTFQKEERIYQPDS